MYTLFVIMDFAVLRIMILVCTQLVNFINSKHCQLAGKKVDQQYALNRKIDRLKNDNGLMNGG